MSSLLPLQSLKVLDFSTLLPGPFATMMLADLGADVVRVEAPKRADLLRQMPPMVGADEELSASHATLNRNKRSVALDLKNPEAVTAIHELVKQFDIVVEQFRPGVMDRLGLGYEALSTINPGLIYCSITGYGQSGTHKDRAGHDINYLALAGLSSYSGRAGAGPVLSGTQVADIGGGSLHAVVGILAAVIERSQSGVGQAIDISMTDATFSLNAVFGANALVSGRAPELSRELLNGGSFYGYYQTADGRYFSIGSLEPKFLNGLMEALGQPDWEARATDLQPDAVASLKADIQAVMGSKTFAEWQAIFAARDVCVEPVLDVLEAADSELFASREMLVEVPVAEDQPALRQISHPIKFSRSQPRYAYAGAKLGQHSYEVLAQAGYSAEQIERILAD